MAAMTLPPLTGTAMILRIVDVVCDRRSIPSNAQRTLLYIQNGLNDILNKEFP